MGLLLLFYIDIIILEILLPHYIGVVIDTVTLVDCLIIGCCLEIEPHSDKCNAGHMPIHT